MSAAASRLWPRLVGKGRAAVLAGRGAGLVYDHGGQIVQLRLQSLPNPHCEELRGGILESGNIVEIVVIELIVDRLERLLDVAVVHDPALHRIDLPAHRDLDIERMAMQPRALVTRRQV